MRTTVAIDDEVLAAAKRAAREHNQTLGQTIEDALRRALAEPPGDDPAPKIPVFTEGTGPRPGIDLTSNRALHEFLDKGLDPDQRR